MTQTSPSTLLAPSPDAALLVLRCSLAAVMAAHGLLKVLVFGMPGTAAFFAQHGFPGWTAWPVMLLELAGAVLLALGLGVRTAAALLIPVMLGATAVHIPNGWAFTAAGGGWEFPAFITATLAALALAGPGRYRVGLPRAAASTPAAAHA